MYGIYAMAASGRMQYDYKQTNKPRNRFYSKKQLVMQCSMHKVGTCFWNSYFLGLL